jgi:predicted acylesterase/phospholipase RssA
MDISGKDSMPTEEMPESIDVEGKIAAIKAKGFDVPEALEKQLRQLGKKVDALRESRARDLGKRVNYFSMLDRMSDMQIQQNTLLALRLTPPDIHAVMRQYAYNTFDFDKAEEIIAEGKRIMTDSLILYERAHA